MKECKVIVKVKNNRIIESISGCGYKNQAEFSRASGIDQISISAFVNFKRSPVSKKGGWTPSAIEMSKCLGVPEDFLFPDFTKDAMQINEFDFEVNRDEIVKLNNSDDMRIDTDKLNSRVLEYVDSLRTRESRMVKMRFGINTEKKTLSEIASHFGISLGRTRQIIDGSMRQMRRGEMTTDKIVRGKLLHYKRVSELEELREIYNDVSQY
jgi:hypothetical protein